MLAGERRPLTRPQLASLLLLASEIYRKLPLISSSSVIFATNTYCENFHPFGQMIVLTIRLSLVIGI